MGAIEVTDKQWRPPSVRSMEKQCDALIKQLERLRAAAPELIRLSKLPTPGPEKGQSTGIRGSNLPSDPTGAEASRAVDHGAEPDPVAAWLADLFTLFTNASKAISQADRVRMVIDTRAASLDQVSSGGGGYCSICERWVAGGSDRLRRGECEACYAAHRRWAAQHTDDDSNVRFMIHRRSELGLSSRPAAWRGGR